MMKHYINIGKKNGIDEPIFMGGGGQRLISGIDCLVGPRMHTLVMGYWISKHSFIPEEVNEEVIRGIFRSPYTQTNILKKLTSVLKQNVFARATKGTYINWYAREIGSPLEGFKESELSNASRMHNDVIYPFNDAEYYATVSDTAVKNMDDLIKNGYPLLSQLFRHLLSSDVVVNEDTLSMVCQLNAIEVSSGYMRADTNIATRKQVLKEDTSPINPGFLPQLKNNIDKLVGWAVENDQIPSDEDWRAGLSTSVTSNSAGGPKVEYDFKLNGFDRSFIASDKNLVFISDPDKWISKAVFDSSMTKMNPGGITHRDVAARDSRAVWMIHLSVFLYETAWGKFVQRWLEQEKSISFGKVGMDAHKEFLFDTSRPEKIIVMKDFSQFDASQQWNNVHRWLTKYFVEAFQRFGLNHIIGDPEMGGFSNVFIHVANKIRTAIFKGQDGTMYQPNQTPSGMLNTANWNSLTNLSQDQYEAFLIKTKYPDLFKVIGEIKHQQILGDDSAKDYLTSRPPITTDYLEWSEVISIAAHTTGFFLNIQKTLRRTAYCEYLKVIQIYGHNVPQFGRLLPFSSENVNALMDPVESVVAIASFYRTLVARGGNHPWLTRFVHHIWNIRRGVKRTYSKRARKQKMKDNFETYPFATIWTPQKLGGCGELPNTLLGASKDALIYVRSKRNGLYEIINDAAHVLDLPDDHNVSKIADSLMRSGHGKKFEKWLKDNISVQSKHDNMKEQRKVTPDIILGDLEYEHMAKRRVQRTLADSNKVTELARIMKGNRAAAISARKKKVRTKDYLKNIFGWMDVLNIKQLDAIPDIQSTAVVVGRHESVRRMEMKIGFSTIVSDQRSRITKLFQTLTDKFFSPESELGFDTLVKLFTRPDVYGDLEALTSVAIRIGADPDNAVRFASEFYNALDSAIMMDRGEKFSSGDELGNTLDLSFTRITELVDIPMWLRDKDVHYLCRQLGIMFILTTPINEPLRYIEIQTLGTAQQDIQHSLLPAMYKKTPSFLENWNDTHFM
jgi:hypothetical protein